MKEGEIINNDTIMHPPPYYATSGCTVDLWFFLKRSIDVSFVVLRLGPSVIYFIFW